MKNYPENISPVLPVEIVLHPSWWHKNTGIIFDEDFFYHPLKRVESERRMEQELYDRFGKFGLGRDHDRDLPVIGPVHNAAGYIISEMLGCRVDYNAGSPPRIHPLECDELQLNQESAFQSPVFKKLQNLINSLTWKYGNVTGDVNWSGVLNVAMDVRGNNILTDMMIQPEETARYFLDIAGVLEKFTGYIYSCTRSTSVSVNRAVRHLNKPVLLHSECSHTMIDAASYEQFLLPIDIAWSLRSQSYGIHYCGQDSHRFARLYSNIPLLDFLDVGWGGNIAEIRKYLPNTFLNIRLDPVTLNQYTPEEIRKTIIRLVDESGNINLTGICCINLDDRIQDQKINTIFETCSECRMSVK